MQQNKYNRIFTAVFVSGIAYVINYGISLVLTPFIITHVSTEAYGYVGMAKSFAQYAGMITTALNSYSSRYIVVSYHREDYKECNHYFNSVLFGDIFLSSIILLISIIFTYNIPFFFRVNESLVRDVQLLFLFIFINFWITTISTSFLSAAYIINRLDYAGFIRMLSYIIEAIFLALVFLLFPSKVFYVGIGVCVQSIVLLFGNYYIFSNYTHDIIIDITFFSISSLKTLLISGIWNTFNALGNQLNSGLDLIVCNLLLSELAMGQLAIVKTLETILAGLLQVASQAFQPLLLRCYADSNREELLDSLNLAMVFGGLIGNCFISLFLAFGFSYLTFWIPGEDIYTVYLLTLFTIFSFIFSAPMTPLYYIYTLTVKMRVPCIVTLIGGLFNIFGMYVGIKYLNLGVFAVVLTTTIVMLFINSVSNPIYMAFVLDLKWWTFYPTLFRNLFSCFVLCTISFCLKSIITIDSVFMLLAVLLCFAVLFSAIHCCITLGYNRFHRICKRLIFQIIR